MSTNWSRKRRARWARDKRRRKIGLRHRLRDFHESLRRQAYEFDRRRRPTRDVAVISYQKSGRTWLRFMLANAGHKLKYDHAGAKNKLALRVDEIAQEPKRWADWRILFLHRDPRDTVVSSYFEATKRLKERFRYHGSIGEFMRDPRYGLEKVVGFNLMWLESGELFKDFATLAYEDLHTDCRTELARVLHFISRRPPDQEVINRAVEAGRFENMRKVELAIGAQMNETLKLGGGRAGDPESMKTRKGKVGGWREYFDASDVEFMESLLQRADYDRRVAAASKRASARSSEVSTSGSGSPGGF